MFPAIWVLNMLLVFGLGAYFIEYERLYLIRFLYALVLPLDVFTKEVAQIDMDVYIFLTAVLIVLVTGVTYFVRFIRDYKPLDFSQG